MIFESNQAITLLAKGEFKTEEWSWTQQVARLPMNVGEKIYAGFDPGQVNMGAALICDNQATIYHIHMHTRTAFDRIRITDEVMGELMEDNPNFYGTTMACVEYASFGNPYGQVALAENRTLILRNLEEWRLPVLLLPPTKITYIVFGNGKLKAKEVWSSLSVGKTKSSKHNDGASALAAAFAAYAEWSLEDGSRL